MNGGELVRFVRREVWRERTLLRATTAEELTSSAWSHGVQRCPWRHRHMSPDSHHSMIRRLFEGWIFLYLLHDLVVLAISFSAVFQSVQHQKVVQRVIIETSPRLYILWFNLPVSGHPRMLVISLFLRASMKEETWKRREEMEEIELLNKKESHYGGLY